MKGKLEIHVVILLDFSFVGVLAGQKSDLGLDTFHRMQEITRSYLHEQMCKKRAIEYKTVHDYQLLTSY